MGMAKKEIAAGLVGLALIAGVSGCAAKKAELDPATLARIEGAANKAESAANKAEAAAKSAADAAARAEAAKSAGDAMFKKGLHK